MYEILLTDPRTDSTVELEATDKAQVATVLTELRDAAVESADEPGAQAFHLKGGNYIRIDIRLKSGVTILIIHAYPVYKNEKPCFVH